MNQVLSQSEVDALLAAVSEGDVGTGGGDAVAESSKSSVSGAVKAKETDKVVVSYDLTSQDRMIRS